VVGNRLGDEIKWASRTDADGTVGRVFSEDISALDASLTDYIREVVALIEARPPLSGS